MRPLSSALSLLALVACGTVPLDAVGVGEPAPDSGLVAHWTFDEGAGTALNDTSGNRRTGVVAGGTWISDGRFAGALHFARGDSVSVQGFPDATAQWTFSGWVRVLESDRAPGDIGEIVSTEAEEGGWAWEIRDEASGLSANFVYWNAPGDWVVLDYALPVGSWSHLTFVQDATAGVNALYVDAVLVKTHSAPPAFFPGVPSLFMAKWSGAGFPFAGALDDIAIYDRALSASEVAELDLRPPPMGSALQANSPQ